MIPIDASAQVSVILDEEDASNLVQGFCMAIDAHMIAINDGIAVEAPSAASRFGTGRHKAALTMGNCFSCAAAKTLHVPWLFKGNDFGHTDIQSGLV